MPSPGLRLIRGIALWKTGRKQQAASSLHTLLEQASAPQAAAGARRSADDALGVLLLTKLATKDEEAQAKQRINDTTSFYLLVAVSRQDPALIPENKRKIVAEAEPFVRNIFP
jgi:hypothetical protein